ncbi:hypothetical protein [Streptomyces sp. NPDC059893]|uniref:hypothetical protein n=1 Tax=Streptomyces sp. NPDC059893 TaxID=3346990 RepID=UPI00365FCB51
MPRATRCPTACAVRSTPRRTGMFGHSLGGDTAAEGTAADHRIMAGADLDGSLDGPAATTGLDRRPFLPMSNASHSGENDPSLDDFWSHLRGPEPARFRTPTCAGLSPLMQRLDRARPLPPEVVDAMTDAFGTIHRGPRRRDRVRAVTGRR